MSDHLRSYIDQAGGPTRVARVCGVRVQAVSQWVSAGRIPADRCEQIERASAGSVTCEALRPDLDWHRDEQGRAYWRSRPEAA
jgi:DNA-binding transcriptional regulator YdaS (Cro superfamily)